MITFLCAEGIKRGYIIKHYSCGHRFLVRVADGTYHIVDLAQLTGTRELRMKS